MSIYPIKMENEKVMQEDEYEKELPIKKDVNIVASNEENKTK